MLDAGQLGLRELSQISQPVDAGNAGAAFEVGREGLAEQWRAAGLADAAGGAQAPLTQRRCPRGATPQRSPERSALATSSMVSAGHARWPGMRERGRLGPVEDSDHDESAGRTSVATQPGGP